MPIKKYKKHMKNNSIWKYLCVFFHSKLFRFLVVGISTTLLDIIGLYVLVEFFSVNLYISIATAFLVAVVWSFFLNKTWTFRSDCEKYKRMFVKFLIISSIWFVLTLWVMYTAVMLFSMHYLWAKCLTTILVVGWNFLGNNMWTFRKKPLKKLKHKHTCTYSIIIPAYNEQDRITDTLTSIYHYFEKLWKTYEILIVDDGSSDATKEVVLELWFPHVTYIRSRINKGKGHAVKKGVLHAHGKYILFTDADNSTPIEEFAKLMNYTKRYDVVIGSRFAKDACIKKKQPWYRVLLGRGGNFLIRNFLIEGIWDTQCGFKLFKRKAALDSFPIQKIKGFWFDMEILLIAKSKGYKIKEVWVEWNNSEFSRVRPIKDGLRTLYDLIYIKLNYWFDGYR